MLWCNCFRNKEHMKKYKRYVPIALHRKLYIVILLLVMCALIIWLLWGLDNPPFIICVGILSVFLVGLISSFLGTLSKFFYTDSRIIFSYGFICYKNIKYDKFDSIVISNASYNNSYGGSYANLPMPMYYRTKGKDGVIKTVFPFITLHTKQYPVGKIKNGMCSRELYILEHEKIYCLGICWFESLTELLNRTNVPLYILEDVYLRFKGSFDTCIRNFEKRCFIITDENFVQYDKYLSTNQ